MRLPVAHKRQQQGFTLIELMVVVAIIAILASIAYPSYSEYITKTRRSAGAACLQEMAQFMERYYTTNMGYTGAALPATACVQETVQHYGYALGAGGTASTYTIAATPTGSQAGADGKCGTLTLNQAGVKSVSGTAGTDVNKCF